jgi:hypothetical protein
LKFDLVRPCDQCPFRADIRPFLHRERAREIVEEIFYHDKSFTCHKTNNYDEEDGDGVETKDSQHCAGAMIMLERYDRPNQMMRWMERIKAYNRKLLDMKAPVFKNFTDFIMAQAPMHRVKPKVTAHIERIERDGTGTE